MKKLTKIRTISIAVLFVLTLAGCDWFGGSNNGGRGSLLVGTWRLAEANDGGVAEILEFLANGTGFMSIGENIEEIRWEHENNALTITQGDGEFISTYAITQLFVAEFSYEGFHASGTFIEASYTKSVGDAIVGSWQLSDRRRIDSEADITLSNVQTIHFHANGSGIMSNGEMTQAFNYSIDGNRNITISYRGIGATNSYRIYGIFENTITFLENDARISFEFATALNDEEAPPEREPDRERETNGEPDDGETALYDYEREPDGGYVCRCGFTLRFLDDYGELLEEINFERGNLSSILANIDVSGIEQLNFELRSNCATQQTPAS